jgi:hypothetical protein
LWHCRHRSISLSKWYHTRVLLLIWR